MSPRPTPLHAAKVSQLNIYSVYFLFIPLSNFSSFISSFQYFSDFRTLFRGECFCAFFFFSLSLFPADIFTSCLFGLEILTFFLFFQVVSVSCIFIIRCISIYMFFNLIFQVLFLLFDWFMITFPMHIYIFFFQHNSTRAVSLFHTSTVHHTLVHLPFPI